MPVIHNVDTQHFVAKWYPTKELGAGGGGKVYRCIRRVLVNEVARFNEKSGGVVFVGDGGREEVCADFVDAVHHHLLVDRDGIGAVKMPHHITDPTNLERFKRELTAMKTCQHPALIRLIDHESGETPRWFAMDYHPNGTLNDNAMPYRGQPVKCLRTIRPIIEGVARLHAEGYIHRDIKPNNIFLNSDGQLILGDFGIIFTPDERLTPHGDTLFSRDWVPDWIRFNDSAPEKKVDVFMLAKVLFYMITGGRRVLASQLDEPDNDLRQLFPQTPGMEEVYQLLLSSVTSKERDCRFEDATQFLREVDTLFSILSNSGRACLLFNYLSTHTTQQVVMLRPDAEGSRYPQLTGIQIFVPFTGKVFRARARVISPNPQADVSLSFAIDREGSPIVTNHYPRTDAGIWSGEISLVPETPIERGWHTLDVKVSSATDGGALTGFVLYGE